MHAFRQFGLVLVVATFATTARAQSFSFLNFDGTGDHTNGTTIDAINNNGQVVGFSTGATGNTTNFIRNPNGMFTTLTANGLSNVAMANGINNADQVVAAPMAPMRFSSQAASTRRCLWSMARPRPKPPSASTITASSWASSPTAIPERRRASSTAAPTSPSSIRPTPRL